MQIELKLEMDRTRKRQCALEDTAGPRRVQGIELPRTNVSVVDNLVQNNVTDGNDRRRCQHFYRELELFYRNNWQSQQWHRDSVLANSADQETSTTPSVRKPHGCLSAGWLMHYYLRYENLAANDLVRYVSSRPRISADRRGRRGRMVREVSAGKAGAGPGSQGVVMF